MICGLVIRWHGPRLQAQVVRAMRPYGLARRVCGAFFAARRRLGRLGLKAEMGAVALGPVAVARAAGTMSLAFIPRALELACKAWPPGPSAASCPPSGAVLRPGLGQTFACDGLGGLCIELWSAIARPEEIRQRVFFLCGVGAGGDGAELAAVTLHASWSALIAGSTCRASAACAVSVRECAPWRCSQKLRLRLWC